MQPIAFLNARLREIDDVDRVRRNTKPEVNARIDARARHAVVGSTSSGAIDERLRGLDDEWDIERMLETNASILALLGTLLAWRDRRWLALPAVVTGFLLQHAVQGWCPPIAVFRRLGIRSRREIEAERRALEHAAADLSP